MSAHSKQQGQKRFTSQVKTARVRNMGFISRAIIPRSVRRAVHPVRAIKRELTPRPIKQARRALHPINNAIYGVTRQINTRHRSSSNSQTFEHSGCDIKHRSVDAFNNCKNGIGHENVPRTQNRADQANNGQFERDRVIRHDVQNDRKLCLNCREYYFEVLGRPHC